MNDITSPLLKTKVSSTKRVQKIYELEIVDIFSEKEYSGHGNFIAYMNYWWLWLYAQNMHKNKKSQNPSSVCGVAHEATPLDWNYWWLFTPKAWIVCCLNKGTQTITNNSPNHFSLLNSCLSVHLFSKHTEPTWCIQVVMHLQVALSRLNMFRKKNKQTQIYNWEKTGV